MNHQPLIRSVDGATTAIVFIHGIAGTPDQFDDLVPYVPENWTLYNLLLDGHGKEPRDFAGSSMKKWIAQVTRTVNTLSKTHDRLLLVGHSMGTLLSLRQALARPEKIAGLFLEAVPLYPRVSVAMSMNAFLAAVGYVRSGSQTEALTEYSSIDIKPMAPAYIGWTPRLLELLAQCRYVRTHLLQVKVPCRCYQSRKDELVGPKSLKTLQRHPNFIVYDLPDSSHFQYSPEDLKFLKAQFRDFISDNQ